MKKLLVILTALLLLVVTVVTTGCSSCSTHTGTEPVTTMAPVLVADPTTTVRTVEVELPERVVIFTDRSWSVTSEEAQRLQEVAEGLLEEYPDAVVRAFSKEARGRLDQKWTDLLAPLREAKICGYSRIFVLTDGNQDPASWEGLMNEDCSFMAVTFVCLEQSEGTAALRRALKGAPECFQHSSVKMEYLDGAPTDVLYDGYVTPTVTVTVEDADTLYHLEWKEVDVESTKEGTDSVSCQRFPWWIIIIIFALALLCWAAYFLWRLFHKEGKKITQPTEGATPVSRGITPTGGQPTGGSVPASGGATPTGGQPKGPAVPASVGNSTPGSCSGTYTGKCQCPWKNGFSVTVKPNS